MLTSAPKLTIDRKNYSLRNPGSCMVPVMATLTGAQVVSLHRAILKINEAQDFAHLPDCVFAAARELVAHEVCGFALVDRGRKAVSGTFSEPDALPYVIDAFPRCVESFFEMPGVTNGAYFSEKAPTSLTDFNTPREFECSDFYQRYYRRMGVYYEATLNFDSTSTTTAELCVARGKRPFGEDERRLLTLLQPHLRQRYRQLLAAEPEHPLFARRLPLERQDWLICSATGEILRSSAGAAGVWARVGLKWKCHLPPDCREWLRRCLDPEIGLRLPVRPYRVGGPEAELTMHCLVDSVSNEHRLLLLLRPARFKPLTLREREVAHWIADGKSNLLIAQMLGISEATVKNHVVSILAKIGGENRAGIATHYWRELGGDSAAIRS